MKIARKHFDELAVVAHRVVGPLANYTDLDPAGLVSLQLVNDLFKIQGSFMALERLRINMVRRGAIHDEDLDFTRFGDVALFARGLKQIEDVYKISATETTDDLITTLIALIIEAEWINRVYADLLQSKRVALAYVLSDSGMIGMKDFFKALRADKSRSWVPRAVESRDLQQTAVITALDAWRAQGAKIVVPDEPLPEMGLSMAPVERKFWDTYIKRVWERGRREMIREGAALLSVSDQALRRKARDRNRETNRTEFRQMTILGDSIAGGQMADEVHGERFHKPTSVVLDKRVILRTKKRFGDKMAMAVALYLQNVPEKEAAERAGIKLNTLKSGIFRLKKEFSKKS